MCAEQSRAKLSSAFFFFFFLTKVADKQVTVQSVEMKRMLEQVLLSNMEAEGGGGNLPSGTQVSTSVQLT